MEQVSQVGFGILSLIGIGVIITVFMKIGDFLADFFKTNKSFNEDINSLKTEFYAAIEKKADYNELKDLDNKFQKLEDKLEKYQIQIISNISELKAIVNILVNRRREND